ncbi:MAG: CYTH domain-containing protein [Clostridia bacterium]|nr:CYTH domain-containing protein [Clostridia bacterium]
MEIERKWLLDTERIPYDLDTLEAYEIEQAYISFRPSVRVRRLRGKNGAERFVLTVKSAAVDGGSLAREEFELPIDRKAYDSLLKKAEGRVIRKTRYLVRRSDGLLEEIDLFRGDLEGLAYLEIEFGDVAQAQSFPSPDWTQRDVTADKRFRNSALARFGMPDLTEKP